jgi:SNF2 family DNA or RNA helicase
MSLALAPRAGKETAHAGSSAKIEELVQLLNHIPADEKSLVFSQFTSFLDKIAVALESERCVVIYHDLDVLLTPPRIPFICFTGAISEKQRREVVNKFSIPIEPVPQLSNQNPRVMLISLKAVRAPQTAVCCQRAHHNSAGFAGSELDGRK